MCVEHCKTLKKIRECVDFQEVQKLLGQILLNRNILLVGEPLFCD